MEALSRRPIRRRAWLAAAFAWAFAAACLSLQTPRRSEPSFPHKVHVVDNKLACTFCHTGVTTRDVPGTPPPELCATCHDKFDADKPPERRVAAFFDGSSRYKKVAESGVPGDVTFSHRHHVAEAKLDCTSCHGEVGEQTEVPLGPMVKKSDCMDCHARYGKANACSECHAQTNETTVPPSHAQDWLHGHGERVRCGTGLSQDRCELCHQQSSSCTACHQEQAPRDHDNTFRTRTHGLQAAFDRSRCMTCHTQDSCQQCHETTRPRSHRGGYGDPQNRHCVSCHLPVQETSCVVCHDGAPSHDSATPLPPGHVAGMNCRMCHGNGQPLPHPDGGHSCTSCHR